MTERKPPGVSFESWIDRQIRAAEERGAFDDLPGAGKPLPGLGRPHDEMWWVTQKLRRENVSLMPPSLALRKEAEDARAAAVAAASDAEAGRIVDEINDKIDEAIRTAPAGPPLNLLPFDLDDILAERRARRA